MTGFEPRISGLGSDRSMTPVLLHFWRGKEDGIGPLVLKEIFSTHFVVLLVINSTKQKWLPILLAKFRQRNGSKKHSHVWAQSLVWPSLKMFWAKNIVETFFAQGNKFCCICFLSRLGIFRGKLYGRSSACNGRDDGARVWHFLLSREKDRMKKGDLKSMIG